MQVTSKLNPLSPTIEGIDLPKRFGVSAFGSRWGRGLHLNEKVQTY